MLLQSLIKQATVNSIPRADLFSASYIDQVQAPAMSGFRPNSLLSAQFSRNHQRDDQQMDTPLQWNIRGYSERD